MALPRTLEEILGLPRVTFHDRGLLPAVSGIYFVLFEAKSARLAYIGKAEDFRARWTGHHREPDLRLLSTLGLAVEISWTSVAAPDLDAAERDMISLFRPPLNDQATHRRRQQRMRIDRTTGLTTAAEIVQDFRDRQRQAVDALLSPGFWRDCNDEDGDLLSLWPFPTESLWPSIHDSWGYQDSHPLTPFRVPLPPAFEANRDAGLGAPKEGFQPTSAERHRWIEGVAVQVDAWLVAVADFHALAISNEIRREVLLALSKEATVSDLFRAGLT